jgi:hypothetical protein
MGSAVWIEKASFRMSAGGEHSAIVALKAAFPTEEAFLARGIHDQPSAYREFVSATRFSAAIRCVIGLGEHIIIRENPEGGIASIGREGMMDELPARAITRFFEPIARFIEPTSFIEFETDHAGTWTRLDFRNGEVRMVDQELGADDLGDWGVIEHDRTEVLLDPTL